MPDDKKKGRVYAGAADKARQKRLEGADTPFQRKLRAAESKGQSEFAYQGKKYAAKPSPQPSVKKVSAGIKRSPGGVKVVMKKKTPAAQRATGVKKVQGRGGTYKGPKYTKGAVRRGKRMVMRKQPRRKY